MPNLAARGCLGTEWNFGASWTPRRAERRCQDDLPQRLGEECVGVALGRGSTLCFPKKKEIANSLPSKASLNQKTSPAVQQVTGFTWIRAGVLGSVGTQVLAEKLTQPMVFLRVRLRHLHRLLLAAWLRPSTDPYGDLRVILPDSGCFRSGQGEFRAACERFGRGLAELRETIGYVKIHGPRYGCGRP
jgi:hypothetical protein